MGWQCSSRLSDRCPNADDPERMNPGSPPRRSNGNAECIHCNEERVYPSKSLRRGLIEALPDWVVSVPEFDPYELEHCQRCGKGFNSRVQRTIHSMEEHSEEINPPTVRVDELETLLDELEGEIENLSREEIISIIRSEVSQ